MICGHSWSIGAIVTKRDYGIKFRPPNGKDSNFNVTIGSSDNGKWGKNDLVIHTPGHRFKEYVEEHKSVMWLRIGEDSQPWHQMDREDVENLALYLMNILKELDS